MPAPVAHVSNDIQDVGIYAAVVVGLCALWVTPVMKWARRGFGWVWLRLISEPIGRAVKRWITEVVEPQIEASERRLTEGQAQIHTRIDEHMKEEVAERIKDRETLERKLTELIRDDKERTRYTPPFR